MHPALAAVRPLKPGRGGGNGSMWKRNASRLGRCEAIETQWGGHGGYPGAPEESLLGRCGAMETVVGGSCCSSRQQDGSRLGRCVAIETTQDGVVVDLLCEGCIPPWPL